MDILTKQEFEASKGQVAQSLVPYGYMGDLEATIEALARFARAAEGGLSNKRPSGPQTPTWAEEFVAARKVLLEAGWLE